MKKIFSICNTRSINPNSLSKKKRFILFIFLLFLIFYYFCLPKELFNSPYSTVIKSKEGELLGAKIASDGQWRFPSEDTIPKKFKECMIYFEDQYFYKHPGFNPISIYKAIIQNNKANKVIRGGSTITQQVIRLSRNKQKRTYFEKCKEIILASRLELKYSKDKILELYATHAPYGSNVVGLEMASWRYFGVQPSQLSWAENATLAVLPNAPSLIYPGKNQILLLKKRNNLLKKLYENKIIDQLTYQLAIEEPLPEKPYELPQKAPHLVDKLVKNHQGKRINTTVNITLQDRINQLAKMYYKQYKQNEIYNLAVLVIDVNTRNIISYVGNAPTDKEHQKDVDIITAPRSTGSILKPLLYAGMLDNGELLPHTLIPDIPVQISGYTPQNYNRTYDGAIPAERALSRSLNIPSVFMLQQYSVYKFYEELQKFKLKNISQHPNHYGLSIILGGAESNLWDLCRTYANLSATLNYYTNNSGKYRTNEFCEPNLFQDNKIDFGKETPQKNILGAGAIWLTYRAMKEVNRPEGDEAWHFYDSSLEIAWKTGTSFGNRDAWAIGTTTDYIVGVWIGNATGEGRPTLTGVSSAAPLMFDVFTILPRSKWFKKPLNDLEEISICQLSGYLAQDYCPKTTQYIPIKGKQTVLCPYHKIIHLDKTEQYRVNSSCENVDDMITKSWFVLPPVIALYYKSKHINYLPLPPFRSDCTQTSTVMMDFIYPKENTKIYLTKNFESQVQPVIVKVAHSNKNAKLFWYINEQFIGFTKIFHEMPVKTTTGIYNITVLDEEGNEIRQKIELINDNDVIHL